MARKKRYNASDWYTDEKRTISVPLWLTKEELNCLEEIKSFYATFLPKGVRMSNTIACRMMIMEVYKNLQMRRKKAESRKKNKGGETNEQPS